MYRCPSCKIELAREENTLGIEWVCGSCSFRFIGLSILKQTSDPSYINSIWLEAKSPESPSGEACPVCTKPMKKVFRRAVTELLSFEVCPGCEMVWMGPAESSAIPTQKPPEDEKDLSKLPLEAAKTVALTKVQLIQEKAGSYTPDPTWWEIVLSLLGLPVELDGEKWVRVPWATLGTVLIATGTSLYSFAHPSVIEDWGFMPVYWNRYLGMTLISSFCIHGGWEHLVGNMYFLILFGVITENEIGPARFLAVLLLSSFSGDLLTYLYDPRSSIVSIGASGGIAGVMLFFAFAYPRRTILWYGFEVSSFYFLVGWFLFQGIYAVIQVKGWEDGIGYYAHLGGGLFGIGCWFFMRKNLSKTWAIKKSILDM